MAKRVSRSLGWRTYEVLQRDSNGKHTITPFSDALAISGGAPVQPIKKMGMLEEIGWPEAKRCLKDDNGKPLIVKKNDPIWLLKCKPTCWRLYFYVWENDKDKRIIYVHAICKKTTKEDSGDAIKAKRIVDGIRSGGSAITAFEFPIG
jgi:hypothetical protein